MLWSVQQTFLFNEMPTVEDFLQQTFLFNDMPTVKDFLCGNSFKFLTLQHGQVNNQSSVKYWPEKYQINELKKILRKKEEIKTFSWSCKWQRRDNCIQFSKTRNATLAFNSCAIVDLIKRGKKYCAPRGYGLIHDLACLSKTDFTVGGFTSLFRFHSFEILASSLRYKVLNRE
jgi:hypothetical protein